MLVLALLVTGCTTIRSPVVAPVAAEARWVLIKNPRFGDVRSAPEYVWIEADKVPTTIITLMHGKSAIIASPDVIARYWPPPSEGQISSWRTGIGQQDAIRRCGFRGTTRISIVHPATGEVLGELEADPEHDPGPCRLDD